MSENAPEKTQKNQQQDARPIEDPDEQKLKYQSAEDLTATEEARKRDEGATSAG